MSKSNYLVKFIQPSGNQHVEMYSGLIDIDQGQLFFYLVLSKTDKLLLWLNGGPGCSSLDGMFLENGPYRVANGSLLYNPYGWHQSTSLLYRIFDFIQLTSLLELAFLQSPSLPIMSHPCPK
jgi:hypothetical protein